MRISTLLLSTWMGAVPVGLAGQATATLSDRIEAHLDSLVERSAIPGLTVGIAYPDGTSVGLGAGWADTTEKRTMEPHDRMLQGSVGKTYFGAVALQLVAEGRLDLDAPLASYLGEAPWFARVPNGSSVSVRQLMNHTSGIVRYELNPAFLDDLKRDPMLELTPEQRVGYLFDTEPPFPAGEGWDYSDTNYILLAMVVERVTGNSAYDEVRRRLLDPLDLDDTVPSDQPKVPGIANGYGGPENPFGSFDATVRNGALVFNPQFEWAGGGFASTAEDLALWIQHVHEGRAFDPALLEQFRTGVAAPLGPQAQYGLGVIMMELPAGSAWGHSGFMPGYRTEAYYFPDYGFAVALQVNTSDRAAFDRSPLLILSDLAELVAAELPERNGPGHPRGSSAHRTPWMPSLEQSP